MKPSEMKQTLWPDQLDTRKGGNPKGRKRKIPYYKIQELMENPRKERILAIFDTAGAASANLTRLKRLKQVLPDGVWYFYSREYFMREVNDIKHVVIGVFIGTSDKVWFAHDYLGGMTIAEEIEYKAFVDGKDFSFTRLEDQIAS